MRDGWTEESDITLLWCCYSTWEGRAYVPLFERGAGGVFISICTTVHRRAYGSCGRCCCSFKNGIRPMSDNVLAKYDALAHNVSATNESQTRPGQRETCQTLSDLMSQRRLRARGGNSSKTAEQNSQTIKRLGELTTVNPIASVIDTTREIGVGGAQLDKKSSECRSCREKHAVIQLHHVYSLCLLEP